MCSDRAGDERRGKLHAASIQGLSIDTADYIANLHLRLGFRVYGLGFGVQDNIANFHLRIVSQRVAHTHAYTHIHTHAHTHACMRVPALAWVFLTHDHHNIRHKRWV